MTVNDFEAMVARARYKLSKVYAREGKAEQRVYARATGGPKINVRVVDGEVNDLAAATVEALLDEENYFQDPQDEGGEGE